MATQRRKKTTTKEVAPVNAGGFNLMVPEGMEAYAASDDSAVAQAEVSGSNPRLRAIKNRFEVRDGDKTLQKLKTGESIEAVIHFFAPKILQRQYFEGAYDPKADFVPPVCFSDDAETPSALSSDPQSKSCDTCPRGSNGSKKCSITSKVVLSVYNGDDADPLLLDMNLNSGSLFSKNEDRDDENAGLNWRNYVKFLKSGSKMPIDSARVITRINLDVDNPDEFENQMLFYPMGLVPQNSSYWAFHDELNQEELIKRCTLSYDASSREEGDDGDDGDEEEEAPRKRTTKKTAGRKTSKKTTSRRRKKPEPEEEEDDDLDVDLDLDEDDDEEEAPPPKRGKKKPAGKKTTSRRRKKPEPEPEPEEEEEDDEEELEEEEFDLDDDLDDLDDALDDLDDDDED